MSTRDSIVIETPETVGFASKGLAIKERAGHITIRDAQSHGAALEFLRDIATAHKAVKDLFAPSKRAADAAHKEIVKAERSLLDPLEAARGLVGMKCSTYTEEQRRIAEAETRRLQTEARKDEEERMLAEAQAADEAGDAALADEILSALPPPPAPVHVAPAVAAVSGVSERETWSAEVTDKAALVRFVADHYDDWQHLIEPVTTQLNALARAQRDLLRIPGVRVVSKTIQSVRQ